MAYRQVRLESVLMVRISRHYPEGAPGQHPSHTLALWSSCLLSSVRHKGHIGDQVMHWIDSPLVCTPRLRVDGNFGLHQNVSEKFPCAAQHSPGPVAVHTRDLA